MVIALLVLSLACAPWAEWVKVFIGGAICVVIILADSTRLFLYHLYDREDLVTKRPRRDSLRARTFIRRVHHYLMEMLKLLRKDEIPYPSAATLLSVAVLMPLLLGAPVWFVTPVIVSFVVGDACARLYGKLLQFVRLPYNPDKSVGGILGYVFNGTTAALLSVVLHLYVNELYPKDYSRHQLCIAISVTTLVGAIIESFIRRRSTLIAHIFDDNLVVPMLTYPVFYLMLV